MFAYLFWNTQEKKKEFYCAIKLNSCIMLSFIHVRTKLKWLLLNRDLQFRVFPCSSWVTAKRLFLHKWKPNLSNWGKGKLFHLLKSSLSKWKYLFNKLHTRTFSGGFVVFSPFLIWYCSFFKQLLKDFYHAKGYSNKPPFTIPWILHVPVLNTPGFNLKLNIG